MSLPSEQPRSTVDITVEQAPLNYNFYLWSREKQVPPLNASVVGYG